MSLHGRDKKAPPPPATVIPTLSEWSLVALSLLLLAGALVALRRRRR